MTTRCRSFEKARYTNNCQGCPCIAAVSQNEVIVGDWSGSLVRLQIFLFAVPAALPNYLKAGFAIYKEEMNEKDDM